MRAATQNCNGQKKIEISIPGVTIVARMEGWFYETYKGLVSIAVSWVEQKIRQRIEKTCIENILSDTGMGGTFGEELEKNRIQETAPLYRSEPVLKRRRRNTKGISRIMDDSNVTEPRQNPTTVYPSSVDVTTPSPEIMNIFTKVVATIPEGRQPEFIKRTIRFLKLSDQEQIQALELLENFTAQATQNPDEIRLNEIKARYKTFEEVYGTDTTNPQNIIAHLRTQFENDLVAFGAKEDRIYMNEYNKIEPLKKPMYDTLFRANKRGEDIPRMGELIPSVTQKVDKRLENFVSTNQTTVNDYYRNKAVQYSRRNAQHHAIPA